MAVGLKDIKCWAYYLVTIGKENVYPYRISKFIASQAMFYHRSFCMLADEDYFIKKASPVFKQDWLPFIFNNYYFKTSSPVLPTVFYLL